PDGHALVTAGYDATLRIWPLSGGSPVVTTLPTPLNTVAVAPDGEIVTAGADGKVYVLSATGGLASEIAAAQTPIIAVAIPPARSAGHCRRRPPAVRPPSSPAPPETWAARSWAPACRSGRSRFFPPAARP